MKKSILVVITAAFAVAGCSSIAADGKTSDQGMMSGQGMMMGNMMKKMDANADGQLSKDEFMQSHEQMFERMKGPNGMIAMNEMPMNCMGMMGKGGMMGQGHHMSGQMEKGAK